MVYKKFMIYLKIITEGYYLEKVRLKLQNFVKKSCMNIKYK